MTLFMIYLYISLIFNIYVCIKQCGKTVICNMLADATEVSGGDYRPTQGVR